MTGEPLDAESFLDRAQSRTRPGGAFVLEVGGQTATWGDRTADPETPAAIDE